MLPLSKSLAEEDRDILIQIILVVKATKRETHVFAKPQSRYVLGTDFDHQSGDASFLCPGSGYLEQTRSDRAPAIFAPDMQIANPANPEFGIVPHGQVSEYIRADFAINGNEETLIRLGCRMQAVFAAKLLNLDHPRQPLDAELDVVLAHVVVMKRHLPDMIGLKTVIEFQTGGDIAFKTITENEAGRAAWIHRWLLSRSREVGVAERALDID